MCLSLVDDAGLFTKHETAKPASLRDPVSRRDLYCSRVRMGVTSLPVR